MRHLFFAAALMAIGTTTTASAQAWPKEPTAVFGIPIGQEIGAGTFPTCPKRSYATGYESPTSPCLEPGNRSMMFLQGINIPGVASSATIYLDDGMVRSVDLETRHESYGQLKAMLVERYGSPTKVDREEVKNNAGAAFPNEISRWVGATNSITLTERHGRVDRSRAVFENNAASARALERFKAKLTEGASKF